MRFDIPYQIVVPLAILAIWALTSLLNREAQPLPPRPVRGPGPGGEPRPGGAFVARNELAGPARYLSMEDRLPGGVATRVYGSRWAEPPPAGRPQPGRNIGRDEGISILEDAAPARPAPPAVSASGPSLGGRGARGATARRGVRGRAGPAAGAAKPAEPVRPRALTSLVSRALAENKARRLTIAPLAAPLAPIDAPLAQTVSASATEQPAPRVPATVYSASSLRTKLGATSKLREIALLSELLQPPLALRPRGRHR